MRILLLLLLGCILGCEKPVERSASYDSYRDIAGHRRMTEEELAEKAQKVKESIEVLKEVHVGVKAKFYPVLPMDSHTIVGRVPNFKSREFSIIDVSAAYPDSTKSKGAKIINTLIYDGCEFWITPEYELNNSSVLSGYDSYNHELWVKGVIEVKYKNTTKTLKEIMLEQGVLENSAEEIFND